MWDSCLHENKVDKETVGNNILNASGQFCALDYRKDGWHLPGGEAQNVGVVWSVNNEMLISIKHDLRMWHLIFNLTILCVSWPGILSVMVASCILTATEATPVNIKPEKISSTLCFMVGFTSGRIV